MGRKKKIITVYTDGACSGNPGPGGYGMIFCFSDEVKKIGGYEKHTTNNRMELMAVEESIRIGIEKGFDDITIYSDSAYVVNSIRLDWLSRWQKNNWLTKKNEPVKNRDLWKNLADLLCTKNVTIKVNKVKGHDGDCLNEMADELARTMSELAKE